MEQIVEGGCACGKTRYQITKKPMFVHCCHCHLCQQQTGSAFILHAFLEPEHFELITGDLTTHAMPAGSGQRHVVKRCSHCATGIISHYGPKDTLSIVKVGTLDHPDLAPPDAHIFINEKLDWVNLPEDVPSFDEFYDFEKAWPAEGYARLLRVRKRN